LYDVLLDLTEESRKSFKMDGGRLTVDSITLPSIVYGLPSK